LIVGNEGTILLLDEGRQFTRIHSPTTENLRSVSWNSGGTVALITGNRGTLLKYANRRIEAIDGGRANLRRSSWCPDSDQALVTSNCFAEEFIPSPNLFTFDLEKGTATALNEGRSDLIGVDWEPNGESALVVGYDVVWHNGFIGNFDGPKLSPIQFDNRRMYPVAIACKPVGEVAAIGTATAQLGVGTGSLYLWDGKSLRAVYTSNEFFFGAVVWNSKGTHLAAVASCATRTFNC